MTPFPLTPIRASGFCHRNRFFNDESVFELDDNSAFQHYSVDATAGVVSCLAGVESSGVDLSSDNIAALPQSVHMQTFHSVRPSEPPPNASSASDNPLQDKNSPAFVLEGCRRCGKVFPYMDQSMDNLSDATAQFCNCTLMGNFFGDQDISTDLDESFSYERTSSNGNIGNKALLRDIPLSVAINETLSEGLKFL